eukprot:CAMPEP_0117647744 /NCGR_PEP_ID=MMETSP0804-20121206/8_1 /TAXON_ID=1074897 /ORGANISM="Tetraselmis astigmatica, Strain CCMP880" /LENGTH=85 /DNA_ID=CAMNT_0005453247 /DNA_START=433 /DNA_END=687 /DNA_ORIENTATION=-
MRSGGGAQGFESICLARLRGWKAGGKGSMGGTMDTPGGEESGREGGMSPAAQARGRLQTPRARACAWISVGSSAPGLSGLCPDKW